MTSSYETYKILYTPNDKTGSETERFFPEYLEFENKLKKKIVEYLYTHHRGVLTNPKLLKKYMINFYLNKYQKANYIFDPYVHTPMYVPKRAPNEFLDCRTFYIKYNDFYDIFNNTSNRGFTSDTKDNDNTIDTFYPMLYCPYNAIYLSNNQVIIYKDSVIDVKYKYNFDTVEEKDCLKTLFDELESYQIGVWSKLSTNDITRLKSIKKIFNMDLTVTPNKNYIPLTELSSLASETMTYSY
ncbi:MAG: hypothetical protein [Cotesia congregata filamentous virus 2]